MKFPDFFSAAPLIRSRDPLAALLGAPSDGVLEYSYADAVRLAGHSCPTVAGAFLTARAALAALYPDSLAERGSIQVHMPAPEIEGVTGVIAQVLTLITGASAANGFKGIGGRYVRHSLLRYAEHAVTGRSEVSFRRLDNGATATVQLDLSSVPPHPQLRSLMMAVFQHQADEQQRRDFAKAWQDRVQRLLLEHADDPATIAVTLQAATAELDRSG